MSGSERDATELGASTLLTWLRSPGIEAYLGASHAFEVDGGPVLMEQLYFAKVSWLFRL